jgi:hypothetical protein
MQEGQCGRCKAKASKGSAAASNRAPCSSAHLSVVGQGVPHNVPSVHRCPEVCHCCAVWAGDTDAGGAVQEHAHHPGLQAGQAGEHTQAQGRGIISWLAEKQAIA